MENNQKNDIFNIENIICNEFREQQTVGIPITTYPVTITYKNVSMENAEKNWHTPSAIVYSSEDGLFAPVNTIVSNLYTQHSTTRSDAYGIKEKASDFIYESYHLPEWESWDLWLSQNKEGAICTVTAVRYEQYVLVRMENSGIIVTSTTTLPDSYATKDLYLSITGELCSMSDFSYHREPEAIEDGTITPAKARNSSIPETVGDIPNLDCIGWWTAHSDGIEIGATPVHITYNTISYQQARENWHTPLIVVFSALDQNVGGIAYNEFTVTRSDGFGWNTGADGFSFESEFTNEWGDWNAWLARNKKGVLNCEITAVRIEDTIIITQMNSGVTVKSIIQVPISNSLPVCIALSGELCSISNIRITRD